MDQDALVAEGQVLVQLLDQSSIKPRAAIWVYNSEVDTWRLWIVPSSQTTDKFEFFNAVANVISNNRDRLPSLDIGLIDFRTDKDPAMQGLGQAFHLDGIGSLRLTNNRFNGFFLPDGVVLRMAI
ncbi:hypothetical protein [Blastomonas sp.]|uniref:hypothetical protein n=1 Tax=Blastomonas sp. TaxID=1909299 RepID=UPI003592EBBF